ncbi:MFS transporter [Streptosporangium lutulentum]
MGTYLVDIAAMVFAFSTALYPFLADELGVPEALGLFYSASAVGSLIASVTSGWTNHVHRHGLGVIISAIVWGAAVALASVMPNVWGIFACLALAGAADMVSGVFRATVWNQTIPDEFRGRLAGIELLSYTSGPMIGNARAGLMADLGGSRFSSAWAACCASARWSPWPRCCRSSGTMTPAPTSTPSRNAPVARSSPRPDGGTGKVSSPNGALLLL